MSKALEMVREEKDIMLREENYVSKEAFEHFIRHLSPIMEFSRNHEDATEPMDVVATNQNTFPALTMGIAGLSLASFTAVAPQPRPRQTLTSMPPEILFDILRRACTHHEPIKPHQWLPGSTKFAHDTLYTNSTNGIYRHPARVNGRLDPALAAVDLMKTCRAIGKIIIEDCLMYKDNEFEFRDMKSMLTYLVAITPERRNAVRSIRVLYDYACNPAPAFVILSTCKRLRHLELDITVMSKFFEPTVFSFDQAPGYAELVKLRGVAVKLVYAEEGTHWNFIHDVLVKVRHTVIPPTPVDPQDVENLYTEVSLLNDSINALTNVARPSTPIYTVDELQIAAEQATIPVREFGTPSGQPSSILCAPAQQDEDMTGGSSDLESPEPAFEIPTEAQAWYAADDDPSDWN
ncbi:hypothetical protein BKA61DRAFT_669070 [Leptodontidium sp. MPI-SDFR-AT-0119]|nr:hypothetical protein BKA61DRAFT_669070 [Leptodontidium sp. MPI-SDFR-AT-0119]